MTKLTCIPPIPGYSTVLTIHGLCYGMKGTITAITGILCGCTITWMIAKKQELFSLAQIAIYLVNILTTTCKTQFKIPTG